MGLYDGRSVSAEEAENDSNDREISLSPGIVLAVFLTLALVCAVFFGFGYSVGRRSSPAAPEVVAAPTSLPASEPKLLSGRSAGVTHEANSAASLAQPTAPSGVDDSEEPQVPRPAKIAEARKPAAGVTRGGTEISAGAPASASPAASAPSSRAIAQPRSAASTGSGIMVQVAAFSHQSDAELVAGALTRRGYDVAVRPEAQDKLLHVQLGPFASKKEADAMRGRLQADGYNAIVK